MTLFLSGCVSTTLVSSKKTAEVPARQYSTILVVGMVEKPESRQVFEEILSDELRKRGVNAISSYTISTLRIKPTREAFSQALKKTGADALLASHLLDVKTKKDVEAGYVMTDRGKAFDYDYFDDYYDYYGPQLVSYATFDSKPVTIIMSSKTTIETTLFDAASGKATWKGSTEEIHADQLISSSKDLASQVLDALAKERLIK